MKTTKTFIEEIAVCDFCQKETDISKRFYVGECILCDKDSCSEHGVLISNNKSNTLHRVCQDHIDLRILGLPRDACRQSKQ